MIQMFIHVNYPFFLSYLNQNLKFLDIVSHYPPISNFMKIRPMEAEYFHADGQTDEHDERSTCFSAILRMRLRTPLFLSTGALKSP